MVELKIEYPFKRDDGIFDFGLIKHWAEDENGNQYLIKQVETDVMYGEAVDIYPCPYAYEITNILQESDIMED